jgi:predicted Rossmann fold nucleotide-binding protein DprA/Smf involved in DNA uptake
LIRDGAHLIRGAQDVLDALVGPGASGISVARPVGPALEDGLAEVLDLVERGAGTADSLACASGLEPGALATALVRLELAGYLRRNGDGRYERSSLAYPAPG